MKNIFLLIFIGILALLVVVVSSFFSFFPLKFKDDIVTISAKYDISPSLVASIIWAESGFNEHSVSPKGAVGLMQLMPDTAFYVKNSLLKQNGEVDLTSTRENIELGVAYLSYLLNKFAIVNTALAAYNAGEGTVKIWLLSDEYSDDGLNLKNIPYKETKDYVNKINFAKKIYSRLI